jgi:hypothetical protein
MRKRNLSLTSAPGAGSNISAKQFFTNNTPDGVIDATVFLDYYEPLTANSKRKYAYLWDLMKTTHIINGMLTPRTDNKGVNYAWVKFELPRGNAEFKVVLFSDSMFDFLVKYQRAEVSVRFTLQELVDEAVRIEEGTSDKKQKAV